MGTIRRLARTKAYPGGTAVIALAVFALVASACGGGGSKGADGSANAVAHLGTTTTTPSATSGAGAAAGAGASAGSTAGGPNSAKAGADVLKFASCMRSHGVANFPNPNISGHSVIIQINPSISGSPDWKTAQAACQHLLPVKPTGQNFNTVQQADYLKAAQCMRVHGINGFPDPDFSGGGVRFNLPPGMNANSTQFEAARETCQKLIPNGLPYSASSEGQ